jgi:excisionase family DNA binding protein
VADEISVSEAALVLGTSGQTVRNYIRRGLLSARRPGARAFLVDRSSVEALLHEDVWPGRRRGPHESAVPTLVGVEAVARERDDLRARVVELREAVLRIHAAAELQRQADAERTEEIEHLIDALRAGERASELRRRAAAELEETIASFALPGHPGEAGER